MGEYAVNTVTSFDACEPFVSSFHPCDPFSDPMLSSSEQIKRNLKNAIAEKERHVVISVCKDLHMVGLFAFLVLKGEHYLEMLVGLSRDKEAYNVMFAYLEGHFPGCNVDFVFNPKNHLLRDCLRKKGATFDTEQQKMVYADPLHTIDTSGVELLTQPYIPSYLAMHNADLYWTGDKVIAAADKFRTFVAIEHGSVVGYLDVTYCFEQNEPFDLLVTEAYRRKGYGRKLLAKALELNEPNGMSLLVDVDNAPAIHLFETLGFVKAENQNSITAYLEIS